MNDPAAVCLHSQVVPDWCQQKEVDWESCEWGGGGVGGWEGRAQGRDGDGSWQFKRPRCVTSETTPGTETRDPRAYRPHLIDRSVLLTNVERKSVDGLRHHV